ncbi:MAG: MFS transporter [Pirellulales bacterium]|nr:MFS transporter [Pirellulales bacterium]
MKFSRYSLGRVLTMFSLVIAGEAIFCLPFHIARYFRPTFVDVFGFSQTQLGVLGSTYGIIATFAYIFGGPLADRVSVRKLLCFSLIITGCSGFYLLKIPSFHEMIWLFAFWGFSTILPFWAALIRATREWGGHDEQGEAFGILDGGRGLIAAVLATLALYFFSRYMPANDQTATMLQKTTALRSTMYVYTSVCFVAAAFVWLFVPEPAKERLAARPDKRTRGHLIQVLKMPSIWLQAIIIVGAYCMFKGRDYFSQYASDIWGWSDVNAAGLSALSVWIRPLAAIKAGFIADLFSSSRIIIVCFCLTGAAYVSFVFTPPGQALTWLLWINVITSCLGIFALRGIYFALLEESSIPKEMTGTAVGVISFIGYTPEIFMPLLGGWLIDRWSGGVTGYKVLFMFLCLMSVVSIIATLVLRRANRSRA